MPRLLQEDNALQIGLLGLFLFLPFAHFLFTKKIDIWHAQGYLCQIGILMAFSYYIFNNNKPLGLLLFWSGITTMFYWIMVHIQSEQYALGLFLPFFNFLSVIILYLLLIKYQPYEYIIKYIPYVVLIIMGYAILQKLNLDQFYLDANTNPEVFKDTVVGTIGNSMHFSHYLAITIPFFFTHKYNKILILSVLGVMALTGSLSGILIALIAVGFYSLFHRIYTIREAILFLIFGIIFLFYKHIDFSSSGRMEMWGKYFQVFTQRPITGWGLGIINSLSKTEHFSGWRHIHNEYYHYAIELGAIGLAIIIYGIIDCFREFYYSEKNKVMVTMASVFLAFILTSLFGYPSHLWLTSSLGIFGYSYIYGGNYVTNLV